MTLPSPDSTITWYTLKDSERLVPTDKLSWAYGPCVEQRNGFRLDDTKGSASLEEEFLQERIMN
ncbi:hypothetical protein DCAR_0831932 [Daucus carota subsp. sativus]|uniref:Uncharacterized protein n=1 Tax=Daucus carota subsp. sativus TaxID=79200 RepID=A0A175YNS0_DAUCS|nr:hypothetical protein DCAR_0831932 [Daucus carota subsp. sativus]